MVAALQQHPRPIQALREQVTALEDAINLTLADPRPKPVHRLRTSTRRIEALLVLLDLLPNLPDHAEPARKARKILKKLRRAAGAVRDLDVQQNLIQNLANTGDPAPEIRTTPSTPAPHEHSARRAPDIPRRLEKHASRLAKTLEHDRDDEASNLLQTLRKLQPRLSSTLERLLDTLAPATFLTISSADLSSLARDWYQHHTPAPAKALNADDPDLLHAIRKSAKLARYIGEVAPARPTPSTTLPTQFQPLSSTSEPSSISQTPQTAEDFESLQQTGGSWHDLLTLADIARHHLGKHSPLTRCIKAACEEALRRYQQHLAGIST